MAISKDWYNTEFEENETESKHRPPSVEYSFYTAVKTGGNRSPFQKPCHESEIPLCGYSCDAYQILH